MREILFRGKLKNGEWVEGGLVQGVSHELWQNANRAYIIVFPEFLSRVKLVEVIPETAGQFTGLCDKNGKKAFSHDVTEDNTGKKWIIFDCPGGFGICRTTEWTRNGYELHNGLSETQNAKWFAQNHSIIGNIHDNPEFLEVSHE